MKLGNTIIINNAAAIAMSSFAATAFLFGWLAAILLLIAGIAAFLAGAAYANGNPDGLLREEVQRLLLEANTIDREMYDPHKDFSYRDPRRPTGDDYNRLYVNLARLRDLVRIPE